MFLMSKKNGYGIKYYQIFDKIEISCLYLDYNIEVHIFAFLGKISQSFSVNQPPWVLRIFDPGQVPVCPFKPECPRIICHVSVGNNFPVLGISLYSDQIFLKACARNVGGVLWCCGVPGVSSPAPWHTACPSPRPHEMPKEIQAQYKDRPT